RELAAKYGVKYLAGIKFYPDLESRIGSVEELMKTEFAEEIRKIAISI
ncbi:ATP-binding protein, partial [Thermococci archaeon]